MVTLQVVSVTYVTMALVVTCFALDMEVVSTGNVYVMQPWVTKGYIVRYQDVQDGQRIAMDMAHVI